MGVIRTLTTVLRLKADDAFKGIKAYDQAMKGLDKSVQTVAASIEKSAKKMADSLSSLAAGAADVKNNMPSGGGGGGGGRGGSPKAPMGYGAGNKFKVGAGRGRGDLDDLNKTDWSKAAKGLGSVGNAAASAGKGLGSMAVAAGSLLATGIIGLVSGLASAFTGAVTAAIDFESAMADVAKVVDGLKGPNGEITDQYREMEKTIFDLSKEIAVAPEGFAKIIGAAAQSGIAREDLDRFAESAAKVSVAFGITAEEAGESMAKLRTGLGLSQDEVESLQGTFNVLDNGMAVTAKQAQEVVQRIGAVGAAAGVSGQEIAGLGAAMISSGHGTEVAATAAKSYYLTLAGGSKATKAERDAFKKLGFDATEFSKRFTSSAEERLKVQRELFESVSKLSTAERAATLKGLFGKENVGAIASVATDIEKFNGAMELALDTTKAASSVQEEYNSRSKTTANSIQLLKNNAEIFAIQLGEKVLPSIVKVAEWLTSPEIQEYGQKALAGLSEGATFVYEKFQRAWEILGPFITALGEGLYGAFQTVWPIIVSVAGSIQELGATILSALGLAGEEGGEAATNLASTLETVLVTALSAVKTAVDAVTAVIDFLKPVITSVVDYITGTASGAFDILTSTVSGLTTMVTGLFDAFSDLSNGSITGGLIKLGQALINGLLEPLKAIIRQVINLADSVPGGGNIVPDAVREFADMGPKSISLKDDAESGPQITNTGGFAPPAKKQGAVAPPAEEGGPGKSSGGGGGSSGKKKKGKEHFASDDWSEEKRKARFDELSKLGKGRKPSEDREYNRLSKDLDIDKVSGKESKMDKALANLDPSLSGVLKDEDGKVHDDILSKGVFGKATKGHGQFGEVSNERSSVAGPNINNVYNNQQISTMITQYIDATQGGGGVDGLKQAANQIGQGAGKIVFSGVQELLGLSNGGGVMR